MFVTLSRLLVKFLRLHWLLALLAPLAWISGAQAQQQSELVHVQLTYLTDTHRTLDLRGAQQAPGSLWRSANGTSASLGYTDAAVWFRIQIESRASSALDTMVEIGYPVLGDVDIYTHEAASDMATPLKLGASLPFAERLIRHRNFVVPLHLEPAQKVEWMVRVVTKTSMQFPLSVQLKDKFEADEERRLLAHGMYVGVVLAMMGYNLYLLLAMRDTVYLWYVGWMVSMAGFVLSMAGVSYQWLWPESPGWNLTSLPLQLSMAVACGILFFGSFVQLKAVHPRGWWWTRSLLAMELAFVVAAFALPYRPAILLAIAGAIVCIVVVIFLAARLARAGNAAAKMFLMTFSFIVVAGCLLAASKIGFLPATRVIEHAPQIGSAVEMLLFSIVLAARMQSERELREAAQKEVIAQHQRWKSELEKKVAERTEELKQLNQSLAKLSRTDPLTGLYNRRFLDENMEELIALRQREGMMMAVMMLDIDHFKRLNDTHGHSAGDACLREVALRLLMEVREGVDVLVRYGGEEFCLVSLVEDTAQAAQLAERLRSCIAQSPIRHGETELQVSISVGLAVGAALTRMELLELQLRADESLYAAKATGRDRWVMAPTPSNFAMA